MTQRLSPAARGALVVAMLIGAGLLGYGASTEWPTLTNERSVYNAVIILGLALVGAPIVSFAFGQLASTTSALGALRGEHEAAKQLAEESAEIAHRIRLEAGTAKEPKSMEFLPMGTLFEPTVLERWKQDPGEGLTVGTGRGE